MTSWVFIHTVFSSETLLSIFLAHQQTFTASMAWREILRDLYVAQVFKKKTDLFSGAYCANAMYLS